MDPKTSPKRPSPQDIVTSDFSALAAHMRDCQRGYRGLFHFHATMDKVQGFISPRIVTTTALFAACGLVLLTFA
jgi:hypothetical protein